MYSKTIHERYLYLKLKKLLVGWQELCPFYVDSLWLCILCQFCTAGQKIFFYVLNYDLTSLKIFQIIPLSNCGKFSKYRSSELCEKDDKCDISFFLVPK